MSTIKVNNLQHPSAASPAIVLDAAGGATVAGMGLVLVKPTSIANSGGSASVSGGAVTFSGVTSVSLNGCFSANYQSYQIIMSTTGTTATIRTRMRLRASGTDNASTEYDHQILDVVDASISASRVVDSTRFDISAMNSTSATLVSMVLTNPFVAAKTQGVTQNVFAPATLVYFGIEHTLSNSYDGFSVLVDSGTFAGSIRVYGLQNS